MVLAAADVAALAPGAAPVHGGGGGSRGRGRQAEPVVRLAAHRTVHHLNSTTQHMTTGDDAQPIVQCLDNTLLVLPET
jgi:hypothetical protein